MANLYERSNGIECRACGAAFAQPDDNGPFCNVCMRKFRYEHYGYRKAEQYVEKENLKKQIHTEDDLNKWLCRQLELHVLRKKKHGFAARCEALCGQDQNGNGGYQCGFYASHISTGRYLCKDHIKREITTNGQRRHLVQFIEEYRDPYSWLQEMISDLSKIDTDFKMSVMKGVGAFK